MARVLVIEDDRRTSAEIAAALGDHGFDVECAYNGRDGLLKATAEKYDAVVLDRMLPGDLDGLGVLATLRTIGIETPVLILSALSAVDERVRGLRAGGDDYLTKPFEFVELTARLEVLIRRQTAPQRQSGCRDAPPGIAPRRFPPARLLGSPVRSAPACRRSHWPSRRPPRPPAWAGAGRSRRSRRRHPATTEIQKSPAAAARPARPRARPLRT